MVRHDNRLAGRCAALLAACLVSGRAGAQGATFTVAEDEMASLLNPLCRNDMYVYRATELLFDSLVRFNLANAAECDGLADSCALAPDGRSITVSLRKGTRWHDGQPVTASDVVYSVGALRATTKAFAEVVLEATAPSPGSVRITFAKKQPDLAQALENLYTLKIIPSHLFNVPAPACSHPFGQEPVGSGLFKLAERNMNQIVLERFPEHLPQAAQLGGIVVQQIPDKQLQVDTLKGGLIDLIVRVRPSDTALIQKSGNRVFPSSPLNWSYLAYNHRLPAVRKHAVREAIAFGLDRGSMCRAALGDCCLIAGPFACGDARNPNLVDPRPWDRARARRLMKAAGYNKKLKLVLLVQPPLGESQQLFTDFRAQLKQIGIQVIVKSPPDLPTWQGYITEGKGFDMMFGRVQVTPSGNYLRGMFHSSTNQYGYKNAKVDALLDQLDQTEDPVAYRKILGQLQVEMEEDLPFTFLWSVQGYSAYRSSRFCDVEPIHPFYYFPHAWRWYPCKKK